MQNQNRWIAMWILCMGTLMIVLDTTIVNVALPSIRNDLHFSQTDLAWVINAYMLATGGSLLIGGKLGDMYGQRKVFLIGMAIFTLASGVCGLATNQTMLIAARAIQGVGGAVVDAVAFAMVVNLFQDTHERTKAMGIFGFVASGGGALGVLAGGLITEHLGWSWNFLVNIPIGVIVIALCLKFVPATAQLRPAKLDIAGACTITAGLVVLVYAIINGNLWGWASNTLLGLIALGILLVLAFWLIEKQKQSSQPLLPFHLLKNNHLALCGIIGMLWAASMFAWFFLMALYLEQVQTYSALQIGMAFLPCNLIMAVFSIVLSAKCVMRWGNRVCLATGMAIVAISLLLCAYSTYQPINAQLGYNFWLDVVPSMSLLGIGCGLAMNPIMMAAMDGIPEQDSGLASGIVNTCFMMGGALGLAVLAAIAAWVSSQGLTGGLTPKVALASGYQWAFAVGALGALAASGLAAWGLRKAPSIRASDTQALA